MESTINAPVVAPIVAPALPQVPTATRARAAGAKRPAATAATRAASRPISVTTVWRDVLTTLTTHPAAILLFAFIGFAVPVIVGNTLYTAAKLAEYARTQAVVTLYSKPSLSILLIQAGLGVLMLTFARGVITWLALCGKARGSFSAACAACRTTFACFPTLLVGSLLYGACITVSLLALNEVTQAFEYVPSTMAHMWPGPHRAFSDTLRQIAWRGYNALFECVGLPFSGLFPGIGDVFQEPFRQPVHVDQLAAYGIHLSLDPKVASDSVAHGLFPAGGLVIIFVIETLLRFRAVAALQPPKSRRLRRFGLFAPLSDSAHLGWRYFATITLHVWLVRLVIFALTVALVEFPVAMLDHFLVPNVMRFGYNFEILPILRFLADASAALVNAILLAFSVVYDARLYAALEHTQDTLNTRT